MTTQLANLQILSPEIVGDTLSVEVESLSFLIQADLGVDQIDYSFNGSSNSLTSFIIVGANKQFVLTLSIPTSSNTYPLILRGHNIGNTASTPTLTLNILATSDPTSSRALPPSGVKVYRRQDNCKIEWVTPGYMGFLGVRVSISPDSTGVTTPFTTVGNLIASVYKNGTEVISSTTTVVNDTILGTSTTTTVDQVAQTQLSSIEIVKTTNTPDIFYAVLSTVIQDPDTKHVFESKFNGPFKCGFVDLRRVNLTDFLALQNQEDVASRLISNMLNVYPDLDLSARSELRDLIVDPISIEIANSSVREYFARIASSVSALAQFDDNDGDGVSDPLESSSLKQSVQAAYGISADNFQGFVDTQFDILGEQAGVTRGSAAPSTGTVTIYTTIKPTTRAEVQVNGVVATVRDEQTPAVNFNLLGSAVVDPTNVDSFYDPVKNWWAVSVPIQAVDSGSIGNVGAGTIRKAIAGIPSGWQIVNQFATDFGIDQQSNADYAAAIENKLVVGVDTGTKPGLLNIAKGTAGVVDARVIGANDTEMLRDWDPVREKHVYGAVDVYVRGVNKSEVQTNVPFRYLNTSVYKSLGTYALLSIVSPSDLKFKLKNAELYPYLPLAPIEILVDKGGSSSFYFGVDRAVFGLDGILTLHPLDVPYQLINGVPTPLASTNQNIISQATNASLKSFLRLSSGVDFTPSTQPVSSVSSINGETGITGSVDPKNFRILRTGDPLLYGNSNQANDRIAVDQAPVLKVKTLQFQTSGSDTLNVDEGVILNGGGDFIIVRNATDTSIKYTKGLQYNVIPYGRYNKFAIQRIATASPAIPLDENILVSYNQQSFLERTILVTGESKALTTSPSPLATTGFIYNIWMPESHGATTLINDSDMSIIARDSRYIKVTYDNGSGPQIMKEGQDFKLSVNETTGVASISRMVGPSARIPDGGTVVMSYFRNEMLNIRTLYPSYVGSVINQINEIKHAGADIIVKDAIETKVNMSMTIEIDSAANVDVVDNKVRTTISVTLDNTDGKLTQAEVIRQIVSIPGVKNIQLPLRVFAKADGSYEVGTVVPTGTEWVKCSDDDLTKNLSFPSGSWITKSSVLPYETIPSGGYRDSYVGFLYGGELYTRLLALGSMVGQTSPCFYILGAGDTSSVLNSGRIVFLPPVTITDPSLKAYKVTYQVFNETGPSDIPLSSTEYLRPGNIFIDYLQQGN